MPYGTPSKETDEKVERCVSEYMSKNPKHDKTRAIRTCKSAILGDAHVLNIQAATAEDIAELQTEMSVQASGIPGNAILKVTGARLARVEINKNNDGLTDEGIREIAAGIRLMPLTEGHEPEPRGVVTRGYVSEDGEECLIDLYIWAGMFPDFANEVETLRRKLSIDCDAETAVCGECGAVFKSAADYCEHIKARSATRWLYGLTPVAAGAVYNPAGTGTVFPGKGGMVVIAHKDEQLHAEGVMQTSESDVVSNPIQGGSEMKCPHCGKDIEDEGKEKAQAELEAALKELETAKANLATAEANLTNVQEASKLEAEANQRVMDRFVEFVEAAGIEVAKSVLPSLRKVDDETFTVLKTMAAREEKPKPKLPPVLASDDTPAQPSGEDSWSM